jgi:hypothetical protein
MSSRKIIDSPHNITTHLANSYFLFAEAQVHNRHKEVHCNELCERLEAAADFEAHALDLVLTFFIPAKGRIVKKFDTAKLHKMPASE